VLERAKDIATLDDDVENLAFDILNGEIEL